MIIYCPNYFLSRWWKKDLQYVQTTHFSPRKTFIWLSILKDYKVISKLVLNSQEVRILSEEQTQEKEDSSSLSVFRKIYPWKFTNWYFKFHPCSLISEISGSFGKGLWSSILWWQPVTWPWCSQSQQSCGWTNILEVLQFQATSIVFFYSMDRWKHFLNSSFGGSLLNEYTQTQELPDLFFHFWILSRVGFNLAYYHSFNNSVNSPWLWDRAFVIAGYSDWVVFKHGWKLFNSLPLRG